jgi:fatty-acyl-CoA synthase
MFANLIDRTDSAYSYPLLIKNMFRAPLVDDPDQLILYRDQQKLTYSQWRERVHRLASALKSLGVKPGDTVAVMDWDSHRYLEAYYAIPMMGAVLHTINVRLSPEYLVYTIEHAEDDVIICHEDFVPLLDAIRGRISEGKKFILINESGQAIKHSMGFEGEYEALLTAAEPAYDFPDFDENTRATTFYTTGTTGMPKGVYYSHRQIVLHTIILLGSVSSPRVHGRFHRESVYMPLTPMFHVHAWGVPYLATYLGTKQVYPGRYVPSLLLKLIHDEKVTFSHCVPTILNMLLKDKEIDKYDLSRWVCIVGGAGLPKVIALEALRRGIDVVAGYGMSETCPVISLAHLNKEELALNDEEQAALRCRTGKAQGLVELRVVDNEGREVPKDDKTKGEILLRAPFLTQGYFKDHMHSEILWKDGWLNTSDVACMNKAGSIRITDRTRDMIKIGGEWVSSLELEDVIARHEGVDEVAVIGQPDSKWSEVPLAIIVPKPGADFTDRDILHAVKASVDFGLLPREAITIKIKRAEAIEKTSVGKVDKIRLREKFIRE